MGTLERYRVAGLSAKALGDRANHDRYSVCNSKHGKRQDKIRVQQVKVI